VRDQNLPFPIIAEIRKSLLRLVVATLQSSVASELDVLRYIMDGSRRSWH